MSKVLLVEDSLSQAQLVTRCLEKEGIGVFAVTSGEEAELRIKQQQPDLILLDVILPGESGFELCRKLKKNSETKAIPIVICSTKNSDVDKTWGKMSGADAYMAKPIDEKELVKIIKQFIG